MQLKIEGAVVTDVGRVRSNNEDNYNLFGNYRYDTGIKHKKETKTVGAVQMAAAVFDGMGGEEAGEVASLMAAKAFMPCRAEEMGKEAARQMRAANDEICGEMKRRGGIRMGTTAAALYLDKGTAVCCNVGDSRCYLMRKGALQQISIDHSEARQMIEMGVLSPEKARQSKSWHKLTQHLGIFPEEFMIEPFVSKPVELHPGDIFLLCSDGLTDMVLDDEIAGILGKGQSAEEMADRLTEAALAHGGRDNVTAMVLQVKEESAGSKEQIRTSPLTKILGLISILLLLFSIAVIVIPLYNKESAGKWGSISGFDRTPLKAGMPFVRRSLLSDRSSADGGKEVSDSMEIEIKGSRFIVDNSILFTGDNTAISEKGRAYLDAVWELCRTRLRDEGILSSDGEETKEEGKETNGGGEDQQMVSQSHADAVRSYCIEKYPELADHVEVRSYPGTDGDD